jgi:hypothetical protein
MGALDRLAQIAERKYCRPQARPFRFGFPRKVTVFPICPLLRCKPSGVTLYPHHLRGLFSSIAPHVAAAVIPPSAMSTKTSSAGPKVIISRRSWFLQRR